MLSWPEVGDRFNGLPCLSLNVSTMLMISAWTLIASTSAKGKNSRTEDKYWKNSRLSVFGDFLGSAASAHGYSKLDVSEHIKSVKFESDLLLRAWKTASSTPTSNWGCSAPMFSVLLRRYSWQWIDSTLKRVTTSLRVIAYNRMTLVDVEYPSWVEKWRKRTTLSELFCGMIDNVATLLWLGCYAPLGCLWQPASPLNVLWNSYLF